MLTLTIHRFLLKLLVSCCLMQVRADPDITDVGLFDAQKATHESLLPPVEVIERNAKISLKGNENSRSLQDELLSDKPGKCYSTRDDRNPNRYCMFDGTPREGAFLSLACPTSRTDLRQCECKVGIGESKDAPNTPTCDLCGFCLDGSLAYDCRNVAEGTCIGRNCLGDCLSSFSEPQDLLLDSAGVRVGLSLSIASLSLMFAILV